MGVVPPSSRAVRHAVDGLYWTRRGLAVAMFVIAAFVAVVMATIVMQFLAVSDTLPLTGSEGVAVHSAGIRARG